MNFTSEISRLAYFASLRFRWNFSFQLSPAVTGQANIDHNSNDVQSNIRVLYFSSEKLTHHFAQFHILNNTSLLLNRNLIILILMEILKIYSVGPDIGQICSSCCNDCCIIHQDTIHPHSTIFKLISCLFLFIYRLAVSLEH